jgi:hypothetical protein
MLDTYQGDDFHVIMATLKMHYILAVKYISFKEQISKTYFYLLKLNHKLYDCPSSLLPLTFLKF